MHRAIGITLLLLLTGCSSGLVQAPVEGRKHYVSENRDIHLVHRGDTLYSIAWMYDQDHKALARWNNIKEPYVIYPGQQLRIVAPAAAKAARGSVKTPVKAPRSGTKPSIAKSKQKPLNSRYKKGGSTGPVAWKWPTRGKLARRFAQGGNKGVDIAGREGQAIMAAADGRVVYAGSGLIGYGKLIIVKHNKSHLSAYAHNRQLLVKEGDTVEGGQRIADMGLSNAREAILHFEIRLNGKPVDPLRYLPKS